MKKKEIPKRPPTHVVKVLRVKQKDHRTTGHLEIVQILRSDIKHSRTLLSTLKEKKPLIIRTIENANVQ